MNIEPGIPPRVFPTFFSTDMLNDSVVYTEQRDCKSEANRPYDHEVRCKRNLHFEPTKARTKRIDDSRTSRRLQCPATSSAEWMRAPSRRRMPRCGRMSRKSWPTSRRAA